MDVFIAASKKELMDEVIAKIKEYHKSQNIIANTDKWIANHLERVGSPRIVSFEGMSSAHNPFAFESKLIDCRAYLDTLEENCIKAKRFVEEIEAVLVQLSDRDRKVLAIYGTSTGDKITVNDLAAELNCTPRHVRRYRDQALEKLCFWLYGVEF